jgi:hypothetical protein
MLKGKSENDFKQPEDLLNGQSGSPTKKSQLNIYPGDVEQVRLLKTMMTTLSTEEPFV